MTPSTGQQGGGAADDETDHFSLRFAAKRLKYHDVQLDSAHDMIEKQRKQIETLNKLTNNAITKNQVRIKEMESKNNRNQYVQRDLLEKIEQLQEDLLSR